MTLGTPTADSGRRTGEDPGRVRCAKLLDNVPDMVFAVALDGSFTFLNKAGERFLGSRRGKAAGRRLSEIVVPEDLPLLEQMLDTALESAHGVTQRLTTRRPDGSRVRMDFTITTLRRRGAPIGFQGVARDVTERERAEIELRSSEERFCQFAEHTREVFYMCEPDLSRMIYISPAYEEVWGRSSASLYLDPKSWIEAVHAEDRARVYGALAEVARGMRKDMDYRIVRPDGTVRWIWGRTFPIRQDDGPVYRILGLAEDITERKKLEEQLHQARKMEAIGQLAGGIAHDFNNLLTAIIGHSELVLEELRDQESLRLEVEEIRKAGERAAAMTRQLLAFSRRQVLQPKVLDLNSTVTDLEKMLRRLIGEHIELTTVLDPRLGRVRADPGQLQQVILNLAVNARDAMPQGGKLLIETCNVELDESYCQRREVVRPGSYVMLALSDTGCGMDAATQARVFEPFFTTKKLGEGTGLGLSTVYGIVKQSGGFIWVYSEVGHGTTFKVYLPRIDTAAEPAETAPRWKAEPVRTETVLVVEDQPEVRRLVRKVLEGRGHTVLEAGDGSEAIETAKQYPGLIHLLLTDLVLPQLSGLQVAEELLGLYPQMRVLFMSGYTENSHARQKLVDSGKPFLQKPFTPKVLLQKVSDVLGTAAESPAGDSPGANLTVSSHVF